MEALSLFQNLQILLLLAQLTLLINLLLNFVLESLKFTQRFLGKIFGRWLVLLDTLKMFDDVLCLDLLFVNDGLQLIILFVDLLQNLLLEALLAHHAILHI